MMDIFVNVWPHENLQQPTYNVMPLPMLLDGPEKDCGRACACALKGNATCANTNLNLIILSIID